MELWAFLGIALVGVVYFIWRTRRGTSRGLDTHNRGLPDDLRAKNAGMGELPNDGRPWSGGK